MVMKYCFLLLSFVTIQFNSWSQLNNGLIAHLPLDGIWTDISGNSNNATASSGGVSPIGNRHMVLSSAAYFNGNIEAGQLSFATPLFNNRTSFTMSYWFNLNALTSGMSLVGQDNILETAFYTSPNRIAIFHPNGFMDVSYPGGANVWHHLTVTCSSTSGMTAYLNGVQVATAAGNYSLSSNTTPTRIGGNVINQNNNSFLWGNIDDVRFYDRVLSLTEIQQLAGITALGSIAITSPTDLNYCAGETISIAYTASGSFFSQNEFVLQMSNASGNFDFPIDIAKVNATTSGIISGSIPDGTPSGSGYKFRVVSTSLGSLSNVTSDIAIQGILGDIPSTSAFRYIGKINGKNLFLGLTLQAWTTANASASANGGRLATIANAAENVYIAHYLGLNGAVLGLTDEVTEGTFIWNNQTPFTYSNWSTGEPNNFSNTEDYLAMLPGGRWNDIGGTATRLPVIELEPLAPTISACFNSDAIVSISSITGASYTWSGPNNYSASSNTAMINDISFNGEGVYTLIINKNGCSISLNSTVSVIPAPIQLGQTQNLPTTIQDGLIFYYPMNGNSNDASGNGINGISNAGVTPAVNRFDEVGQALRFNGTTGFIDVPDASYFTGIDFTVSAWINPTSWNFWSRVLDFGNGPNNNNIILAATNGSVGRPAIQIFNGAAPGNVYTSPSGVTAPIGQWTHLTFTYQSGVSTLYLNGVSVASGVHPAPVNVVRTFCYIGRSNWSQDGYYNGLMDDLRVYNRSLNTEEIALLVMEQNEALNIISQGGLFCEGSASNLLIVNSQPGVSYRLRNAQTLAFIGNAQNGTGDTLTFSTGALMAGMSFEFVAASLINSCQTIIAAPSNFTVLPLPNDPSVSDGSVCNEGVVNLVASSSDQSAVFNWYDLPSGGTLIQSGNNAAYTTNSLTETTVYYVSVVNANGCESSRIPVQATVINPLNPPVDIINDLILFYKMDGNLLDESGNGIDATVQGGSSFYTTDRLGNESSAINIGPGAYLDAGNPAPINALTNQVTISMWVRQTQSWFGDQTPLFNKWGGTGMYIALDGFNASNPQNPVRWRINGSNFLTSNTNVPLLQWHHIVCTYNGAQLRIFQNGVLTGTLNQTGNIPVTGNNLQIGRQSNGLGAIDYRGDIDHVRVYSRALNASEIQTLFNNESVAFGPAPFCDGQGNVALSTFNFPGATYQWTGPNNFFSTDQNPSIINNAVAGVHDGEYVLEVTANGCISPPQPVNVVINEYPDAPTTQGAFVCQSGFASLTASGAPSGGSYRWYTVATGGTPISGQTGPTLVIPNVTATTSYYVSIVANGCEGPRAEVVAFLHLPLDLSLTVTSDYSICYTEESITLQINNTQEGVQYTPIFGGQPFAETQTGPGNLQWEIPMSELVPGTNKFTFLAEQTGCLSGVLTNFSTVNIVGETTASIKSSEGLSICEGISTTLTAVLADSYLWSTGETTQTIEVSASGTYSVTITALEDCIYTADIEIDVIDLPDLVISAESTEICEGSGASMSTTPQAGLFYQWYFNGEALSGVNSSMYFAVDEGTYQLQTFGNGCLNWSNEIEITTIPVPTGFFNLEGPQVFCEETELFYTLTGLENVDNYNWIITPEGAATLVSGQGTTSVQVVPNADVFTIDVIPSNLGCVNITSSFTVSRTNPLNAPIEGPTVLDCANAIVTYSVPFNDEVSNYAWTLPIGAQIISGESTNVIEVAFGGAGGEISVVETTGTGCIGEIQTLTVECIVSTDEKEKSASLISVYPNPTKDQLIVDWSDSFSEKKNMLLEVRDISGRLVHLHTIQTGQNFLSLQHLSSGTYILQLPTPTPQYLKVVKEE